MPKLLLLAVLPLGMLASCTGSTGGAGDGGGRDTAPPATDGGTDGGTDSDGGTGTDGGGSDSGGTDGGTDGGSDSGGTDGGSDSGGSDSGGADSGAPETFPLEVSPALTLLDKRPTNLVVITVDTLRRDRINHLGYRKRTITPQIDVLYSEGVGLQEHRSCTSWTLPSFLCALTGQDQGSLGWWPPNNDGLPPETPDDITLMAEYFRAEGFYTLLWGASGFLGSTVNMDQGYIAGQSTFGTAEQLEVGGITAKELVTGALEAMDERPEDQPLMMHLHFIDPHMPYVATDDLLTELGIDDLSPTTYDYDTESGTLLAWRRFDSLTRASQEVQLDHMDLRYDAEIKLTDEQISRFLSSEQFDAIRDDTLVVFFSDHGEEFQEHGNFNHGYNLYEHQIKVPAALWWPGHLSPAEVDEQTMHQDLLPTIFALFGFETDGFAGRVIGSEPPAEFGVLDLYRTSSTRQAVMDKRHKLVYRWDDTDDTEGSLHYFDLAVDPTEQADLYSPDDPDVIRLWEVLEPRVEELKAAAGDD